jgi:hypothetical protein
VQALLKRYSVPRVSDIPRAEGPRLLRIARALRAFQQAETGPVC